MRIASAVDKTCGSSPSITKRTSLEVILLLIRNNYEAACNAFCRHGIYIYIGSALYMECLEYTYIHTDAIYCLESVCDIYIYRLYI